MSVRTIKTVIFMGSARNITPPWEVTRLGDRVLNWVKNVLSTPLSGFTGADLRAPVFFMRSDDLPPATKELGEKIRQADCYLIVSPEYNHTIPPALSSIMGHFGGSNYKCKPSGIVTYSPSPFAGMRAAMAIQIMCHELGCLPVSKLCGIPNVSDLFDLDGTPKDQGNRLLNQLPELLTQLEWMAVAMANQREKTGTF
ncbi:hypothetical protein HJC23_006944 [Cyclotella cryptica]|uniref:NADPH-dependent FMN reductase-like domain-containing protein n=1 Tax=Cyclotella cryptica TaxID=29204 RepID=A0ABD3QM91_9STRA|eukprot:CCRYP_004264-RA/>CCRYP_004264-RA protein AED:0.23 eAED:0.23 QI:0/0/0/1/1/1/2/0/197